MSFANVGQDVFEVKWVALNLGFSVKFTEGLISEARGKGRIAYYRKEERWYRKNIGVLKHLLPNSPGGSNGQWFLKDGEILSLHHGRDGR